MKFFAYLGNAPLDKHPLGTANSIMFELKTHRGAIRHVRRVWPSKPFMLFTYTNFYDDKSFKLVTGWWHRNMRTAS